ncbi:MAG: alpha/beta fold hydrolase [Cyclobacteriaceae bacterium]
MKGYLICLIGLFLFHSSYAQKIVKGKVLDRSNSQAIAFANVGIINTTIGDLSDENGFFKLLVPDSLSDNKITFHAPGYEQLSLHIRHFNDSLSTIYLSHSVIMLEEVVITKKGPKVRKMEMIKKEKIAQQSSMTLSQTKSGGAAIASLYSFPFSGIWLDQLRIKINQNLVDSIKLRIRILSYLETGLPGTDLYPASILKSSIIENGWWIIDLEELGIYINESKFFICYELIEDIPTRMMMERRREKKTSMMYELYDQGIKGIQIKKDSSGRRAGWVSSLTKKELQKSGVDFPTGNTYFSITPSKDHKTFIRKSSFDQWRPLYDGRFSLVSGVSISYLTNSAESHNKPAPKNISYSYPIVWGYHKVGFRSVSTSDSSRYYNASSYEDGSPVQKNTYRPTQLNIWHPTNESNQNTKFLSYVRTLTSVERDLESTKEIDAMLVKSLIDFGFTRGYVNQETNAQLNPMISQGQFPLILYIPGLSGDAIENYKLCELLASYGYIVISIPSLGNTSREMQMNAQEIITQRDDVSFAINWAKKNLPITNDLGIIGYSWGSMAGLAYATNSTKNVKTIISLDGSIYSYSKLLEEVVTTYEIDSTSLVVISSKELDKQKFTLFDKIKGREKRFIEIYDMNHDEFISMGVDLLSKKDPEIKDRYSRLCSLIQRLVNNIFYSTSDAVIDPRFMREWTKPN